MIFKHIWLRDGTLTGTNTQKESGGIGNDGVLSTPQIYRNGALPEKV